MQLERIRWWGAPIAAFASSCLVLFCLVGAADLALDWPRLRGLTSDLGGWAALALVTAVATALLGLVAAQRVGPAAVLAVGAVSSVLAVTLSHDLTSGAQLVLVLFSMAVATGAGFAAGLVVGADLPEPWAKAAAVGWLLPLAAGWAPLAWLLVHGRPVTRLTWGAHLSPWVVGSVAAVSLGYAVLCAVADAVDGDRVSSPPARAVPGEESTWVALGTLVVAGASVVMVVGFRAGSAPFVRPVVLLITAASVAGLGFCGWLVQGAAVRAAYVAVVVAWLTGPSCVQVLMLASARDSGPVPWWVPTALSAAALGGCVIGWWRTSVAMPVGLLVLATGCAAGWLMPTSVFGMAAAIAPVCVGTAMAATAGLRSAGAPASRLRLVALAGLVALLVGLLTAYPLTWALGAQLSADVGDVRAGGRVLLGLTFALAVLGAAGTAVLDERARQGGAPVRRPTEPVPPLLSGPREFPSSAPPNAARELPDNDTGARSG